MIRQPIISVLGHVDHGKTTLLDYIRSSAVAARESGGITQHIGATEIPIDVVRKICGKLLQTELKIPGLLFIDTPGHKAFTNLRRRGGSLADLAVLVVDINEGIQPQTIESITILKRYKTPFIIAANKIDRLGWDCREKSFTASLASQRNQVRDDLDNRIWELVGNLYEYKFEADRFDRIKDFTRKVAIIPVSAKEGVGVPELLMLISGLSQKYLEDKLKIEVSGRGTGTILEVKEEVGLGPTIDVILYDGTLRVHDPILFVGKYGVVKTTIRALLKPRPLDEIRDPRFKFDSCESVSAAAGLKISAPNLETAMAGSPLYYATEEAEKRIMTDTENIKIKTESAGVILKADALGSLEAIVSEIAERMPIKKADVGDVTKIDVAEAISVKSLHPYLGVIFAFNVGIAEETRKNAYDNGVKIFESDIIYRLLEDYDKWVELKKQLEAEKRKSEHVMPGKFRILPQYIFRKSNPAIVGVEILGGTIKPKYHIMNDKAERVGQIKSIKSEEEFLSEAGEGSSVAISIEDCVVGRHIHEGEVLYIDVPKTDYNLLKKQDIDESMRKLLSEVNEIKSKKSASWYM